ncbi:lactate utilization protein [Anaerosporobacter faecicola]|uniref:lactate utilization protein n=1 Tax=Anaerosporobacter faecicola TaxID=2718714 RepID=UPI0014387727|nr:lactate utilization protein [Anaerosporobacter faecicola]
MNHKQEFYKTQANSILEKCQKRGMQGHYCETKEEALAYVSSLFSENASISWGGSESIREIGLFDYLKNTSYTLYDRATAKTPEEQKALYAKTVTADYFLMSTNAITLDGQLVNVDGNGNRVACLVSGPEHVIIVAGMNKVVPDVEAGIARVHNMAAPPNAIRLNRQTPCHDFGRCSDCLSADCMCSNTVITRKSNKPGRLIVVLVGEELGY